MPSIYIAGANTTAQWYQDEYPGAAVFPRIDKFLLHTTETGGWPGYGAGASAPTATYYPKWRQIRQHFGINRSARALRDPSSTLVRENRDNVFQLEIICYSQYSLAVERGGLWVGDLTTAHMRDIAAIALQCHRDWGLPLQSTVTWREGRKTYYNDVRLTGPQYDAYRGILAHVHASGNDHWDAGGFRYSRLEDALSYQFVNHPVYGSGGVTIPPPTGGGTDLDPEDDMTPEEHDALYAIRDIVLDVRSDTRSPITRLTDGGTSTPRDMQAAIHKFTAETRSHVVNILGQLDQAALIDAVSAAVVAKLPTGTTNGTEITDAVKQGIREVLGSLDDAPA